MKKVSMVVVLLVMASVSYAGIVMENNSFESEGIGTTGWNNYRLNPVELSTSNHSGSQSAILVLEEGQEFGFLSQDITSQVKAGDKVSAKGYVKADKESKAKGFVKIEFMNDNYNPTGEPAESSGVTGSTGWVLQTASGVVPPNTTRVVVGFGVYSKDGQTGSIYVDDIEVK